MMKRIVLFLLVCLMPLLSVADDTTGDDFDDFITGLQINVMIADDKGDNNSGIFHDRCEQNGAYSGKYTIDRRCYITDEQKKQFPYNAVVGVFSDVGNCTGTLVKDSADKLYVYTAAHCIKDRNAPLTVKLQDGTRFSATPDLVGVGSDTYQDVAVLTIPEGKKTSLPFVKTEQFNSGDRFNIIGYGSLAILSDNAIHDIKQIYANYMNYMDSDENKLKSDDKIYETFENKLKSDKVISAKFDKFLRKYTIIFDDNNNLKGSFDCSLRDLDSVLKGKPSGSQTDCQAAPGNSGGPIFDKDGSLVAVHTQGIRYHLSNQRYAATFLGGQEPVSVVQKQLYDYKLMVYLNDIGCYIETEDGKNRVVGDKLCNEKKPPRSFNDRWWVGVKNGKTTWGVSHCYNKDKYPGATSINFSIPGFDLGRYCWCRFINQTSKNQEEMAYFSGNVYDDKKKCEKDCAYACAKWFLGE